MVQQFIHGTQSLTQHRGRSPHIAMRWGRAARAESRTDELVMMRLAGHGDLYIQQDANWNVIGAILDTTLRSKAACRLAALPRSGKRRVKDRLVERYEYTPYGELTVHQESSYGDYDGDQDVDDTDRAAIDTGGACLGGSPPDACRVLDLDFDGDYDSADLTLFDALDQGYMVHPGRRFSSVDQPFGHQGLLHEPEVAQYQNRARQYDPGMRRFVQRDPVAFSFSGFVLDLHYTDGLNLYGYQLGNPLVSRDPSGMECETDALIEYRTCINRAREDFSTELERIDQDFDDCIVEASIGLALCLRACGYCPTPVCVLVCTTAGSLAQSRCRWTKWRDEKRANEDFVKAEQRCKEDLESDLDKCPSVTRNGLTAF